LFVEENNWLEKNVQQLEIPKAVKPFREIFLKALSERQQALEALARSDVAFHAAGEAERKAVSAHLTAWQLWDY